MEKTLPQTIVDFFGLDKLPEETRMPLVKQISDLVMKGLMIRISQVLSPEQSAKLNSLLSGKSSAPDVVAFLETELPQFATFITEELQSIKANM
jgi:hypothetical protein